jgi:hypothetical protein
MSDIMNLAAGAAEALAKLPRKTWTIPESARNGTTDPGSITLRHLTYAEEKAAMEAKEKGGHNSVAEGTKRAICAADGKPITWVDNQAEDFFISLSPKVRELCERAFLDFCMPSKEESDAFLASGVTGP